MMKMNERRLLILSMLMSFWVASNGLLVSLQPRWSFPKHFSNFVFKNVSKRFFFQISLPKFSMPSLMMSLMMSGLMMSSGDMSPLYATKTKQITSFEMTFLLECNFQAIQIWTAVHTRWLSKLTCRWQATRGGPVGFSRHPSDLSHLIYFDSFLGCGADAVLKDQTQEKYFHHRDAVNHPTDWTCNYCNKTLKYLLAPGRARDDLSRGSKNVAACKSGPEEVFNEMVLQRKEQHDQQKAPDKTKAAKAELKKRVLGGAEQSRSSKKQTSIAAMEMKMRSEFDQQWGRFVFHAGVPFHLTEDPELDEFFIMYEHYIVAGLQNWGTPDRQKIWKSLDTEYETLKTWVSKEYFANDDYTTMASVGGSNVSSITLLPAGGAPLSCMPSILNW